MEKGKNSPYLRHVFQQLILFRLFFPLMVVALIAIAVGGYLEKQNLINQQNQVVQSVSHIVDHHIDHGGRILDAVARIAETSGTENLSIFMKNIWESYGYFETLYYLDKDTKITLMMPSDPQFTGLDMSNMTDFKKIVIRKALLFLDLLSPFVQVYQRSI